MESRPHRLRLLSRIVRGSEANRQQRQLVAEVYEAIVPIYRHGLFGPARRVGSALPPNGQAPVRTAVAGGAS